MRYLVCAWRVLCGKISALRDDEPQHAALRAAGIASLLLVPEAVARLRAENLLVTLDLIGPAHKPMLARLTKTLRHLGPAAQYVRYRGPVERAALLAISASADLCLFASSCENMPNILLEGMASGLPVACSNPGPMPEMLGSAAVYFDPEDTLDIAKAIRSLIESPDLRSILAPQSFARAGGYSWKRCATETFEFLAQVARRSVTQRPNGEG